PKGVAIRSNGSLVGSGRGRIALPLIRSRRDRLFDLAFGESMRAIEHLDGQIAAISQRLGLEKIRFRLCMDRRGGKQQNQAYAQHHSDFILLGSAIQKTTSCTVVPTISPSRCHQSILSTCSDPSHSQGPCPRDPPREPA